MEPFKVVAACLVGVALVIAAIAGLVYATKPTPPPQPINVYVDPNARPDAYRPLPLRDEPFIGPAPNQQPYYRPRPNGALGEKGALEVPGKK